MSIVYILTNKAMPNLVKIGKTEDLILRMKGLYQSGVPFPFECVYAARVVDAAKVEKSLHFAFSKYRVNENREFFDIEPAQAAAILELLEVENVTPGITPVEKAEDTVALEKASQKAARFNFEMVKIPEGAELQFSRDENVTCRVVDKHRVLFQGENTSLSEAAKRALHAIGKTWGAVQGPSYWMYEGETLVDRRERMETEE